MKRRVTFGRFLVGIASLSAAMAAPTSRAGASPAAPRVADVVGPTGAYHPSISADGSLIAYEAPPAASGDDRATTIWLHDRVAGTDVELTPLADGVAPGNSRWPVVSADGCSVTVLTEMALDLFRDDNTGSRWDVYRQLLPRCNGDGTWDLVSASRGSGFDAAAGDDADPGSPPSVSATGAVIAYTYDAAGVADRPGVAHVAVVDLAVLPGNDGRWTDVAGTPAESPDTGFKYRGLREPSVSGDGLLVAYTSDATSSDAAPTWATGPTPGGFAVSSVYLWDRGDLDRVSSVRRLDPGTADSGSPTIAANGNIVAFVSASPDLVAGAALPACNPTCVDQVYLYDRRDATIRLGSRIGGDPAAAPVGVDEPASQPALDAAGTELIYVTRARNLFDQRGAAQGAPGDGEIVVATPATGEVHRLSVGADGSTPAPAANADPKLSSDGRVAVFDTLAGAAFGQSPIGGRRLVVVERTPVLDLADLDMGTVAVGFPGPEWVLYLRNAGPATFTPATVTTSDPEFIVSGGSCVDQVGQALAPGATCAITLMFMPATDGGHDATLTVAEADGAAPGSAPALKIDVALRGQGGEPELAPEPAGLDGGDRLVGARSEPMIFTVDNVAFNPVSIATARIVGAHPEDFQISADDCSKHRLDAGATCTVQVIFTPTAAGRRLASMVVTTAGGSYTTMLLSGNGHFEPRLASSSTVIVAGSRVAVIGAGFAPNTAVTLRWADGSGRSASTTTDANGSLIAELVVLANDRRGPRSIVAVAADGSSARADVQVAAPSRVARPRSSNAGL